MMVVDGVLDLRLKLLEVLRADADGEASALLALDQLAIGIRPLKFRILKV
jgi:hypothetical protein